MSDKPKLTTISVVIDSPSTLRDAHSEMLTQLDEFEARLAALKVRAPRIIEHLARRRLRKSRDEAVVYQEECAASYRARIDVLCTLLDDVRAKRWWQTTDVPTNEIRLEPHHRFGGGFERRLRRKPAIEALRKMIDSHAKTAQLFLNEAESTRKYFASYAIPSEVTVYIHGEVARAIRKKANPPEWLPHQEELVKLHACRGSVGATITMDLAVWDSLVKLGVEAERRRRSLNR